MLLHIIIKDEDEIKKKIKNATSTSGTGFISTSDQSKDI